MLHLAKVCLFALSILCSSELPMHNEVLEAAEITDWSQWRGPNRSGVIKAERDWPNSLDEDHLKKSWSVDLPPSYSSPIVIGNRLFTTETRDKKSEVVRAFNKSTGEQLWEVSWSGTMKVPFFAAANGSWIRSTPAADENFLYVAGMRDVLVCINQESGKIVWKVDFVEKFGTSLPSFGFVCSPLLDGEFVFVQAGGGFVKLNKADGSIVLRVLDDGGGMSGSAFSSPVIETVDGVRQILVQTRTELVGVEIENGAVLWKKPIEAFRGMNILTPILFKNSVFTSSYGGGTVLINTKLQGTQWETTQLWRNKLQGYMSTPLLLGENVYMHLRNQRFASINLSTGKENWVTKPYGKYWSMVSDGKKILALDSRGDLLLIEPSPEEFRLIDNRHISDSPTWAHLAVSGDQVYIRALDHLTVYNWK